MIIIQECSNVSAKEIRAWKIQVKHLDVLNNVYYRGKPITTDDDNPVDNNFPRLSLRYNGDQIDVLAALKSNWPNIAANQNAWFYIFLNTNETGLWIFLYIILV